MGYEAELAKVFGGPVFLSAEQLREVDRRAAEDLGLPGLVLMENAGMHSTRVALEMLPQLNPSAVVFCGAGNNGGDGYVIARQLHLAGVSVRVLFSMEPGRLTGDAFTNAAVANKLGIKMRPLLGASADWGSCDLAIDALLGTGMGGPLREDMARILKQIHQTCQNHPIRTLAIDLPSGLHANSGEASEHAFRAERTVTFVAKKLGFAHPRSLPFTGSVDVVSIGVPAHFINHTLRIE